MAIATTLSNYAIESDSDITDVVIHQYDFGN
jgi:hypothetical protein